MNKKMILKDKRAVSGLILAVLFIAAVRTAVFNNPRFWDYACAHLDMPSEIGALQQDTIRVLSSRVSRHLKTPMPYLAAGSSQVNRIFENALFRAAGGKVISIAYGDVLTLLLYPNIIRGQSADNLILYFSEYDFFKPMKYERMKYSPPLYFERFRLFFQLFRYAPDPEVFLFYTFEAFLSDLFPEYKYRFVFQGFLKKIQNKFVVSKYSSRSSGQYSWQKHLDEVDRDMRTGHVYFEMRVRMFEMLLERLGRENPEMSVFVFAGDIHPDAHTSLSKELRARTTAMLRMLSEKYPHLVYVPEGTIQSFQPEEYSDVTHIKPENAAPYIEGVIKFIVRTREARGRG